MVWECLCLMWKLTNGQRRLSRIRWARRPGLQMSAVLFPQHHEYYSLGSGTEWPWQRGELFVGSVSWTSSHKADLATTTTECLHYQEQRPTLSPAYSSKCVWCGWHGRPPSYWLYWTPFTVDLVAVFFTRMGICSGYRFDFPAMLLLAMSSVDSLKA